MQNEIGVNVDRRLTDRQTDRKTERQTDRQTILKCKAKNSVSTFW